MEPQSKVRKNQNRAGDATLGHGGRRGAGAGQGRSKSSQGVAGGEKACKRGRLRDQGPRHDATATATAMQLSLGKQGKSRDGGLGQDQQTTGDALNEQQTLEDDGESQGSKSQKAGSEARTKVQTPRSGTDGK
jgi:hypothetical protein